MDRASRLTVDPYSMGKVCQRDISNYLEQASARLARLEGSTLTFGVIRMWPDQPVAEHENVERLSHAARLIGASVIELDRFGRILKSPGEFVTSQHVDFVLHLHFETAKTYDAVSIGAMWNPLSFYSEWGFGRFWANQMSHDIFATTGAGEIESLIRSERGSRFAAEMPVLNHSLAAPIYLPAPRTVYRAFYCGINWEKVDGRPGRHGELLAELDSQDKVDIYGPEMVRGIKVWDGYRNYCGPLPFDGKTVIKKISQAGACLVLSSDAHKASGIMSNRLFEAMAGGAVVIGDEHPFISQALDDHYIRVPSHLSASKRAELIVQALNELDDDPERAMALASAAQDRLVERYLLSTQIAGLFEAAHRFSTNQREVLNYPAAASIDIVIQPIVREAAEILCTINALAASFGTFANFIILAPEEQTPWYRNHFGEIASIFEMPGDGRVIASPSECLIAIGHHLKTGKVAFFLGIEKVFADAYLTACRLFADRPVGRVGHSIGHHDDSGTQCFDYQAPQSPIEAFHPSAIASLVFDRHWLLSAPKLHGLPWKGLVKLAEITDDSIAASCPTAIIVNAKAYERALRAGVEWHKEIPDFEELIERFGAANDSLPSGVVLRRRNTPPSRRVAELPGPRAAGLLPTFEQLSSAEKLRIGLQIYHALPLPRWLQRSVRLVRKALGIR